MNKDLQTPFDIAIVVATVVRPTLAQAIRSVYAQRFGGRIQVLIGIDQWQGERAMLDALVAECPSHVAVTQLELGYSTSQRHGGLYPSHFGGALKTLLSYAANIYARAVTGLQLFDSTGGFKCFRRRVLESIDLSAVKSNGYAFQIEMSFRAWKKGFRIAEIPIVFVDRTEGESKMSKRIVREAVWMVWRLRWWAISGKV